ncbi:MAG: site-specific DNA-methyltransferase [Planctomycetes bacterium]|nr:site-specific DNA-methyltransferase [Planctomycetota bacterium]
MSLHNVEEMTREAEHRWGDRLSVDDRMSRALVSFQANRGQPQYRWFKYKEAFSVELVEFVFEQYGQTSRDLLDPFAGSGTALFAAASTGRRSEGIEILPIGQEIIEVRALIRGGLKKSEIELLAEWARTTPWRRMAPGARLNELRITKGAFPTETDLSIRRFLSATESLDDRARRLLRFALLCVLESVSFTRKDGQYLRWDYRSGRRQGAREFDKGAIQDLDAAMRAKLSEMSLDLLGGSRPRGLFSPKCSPAEIRLHRGSCLEVLPTMPADRFDIVVTSPPYCNRYDYTRTYALELAALGVGERELRSLRQAMLTCTVENKEKDVRSMHPAWRRAIDVAREHGLLEAIMSYLDEEKRVGRLNNNGIPRMVRGYFLEMACVIAECARVLRSGSPMIMVNDNVRYAGACVPVDLILSEFAERLGFTAERIIVLPGAKGNSSQQMGAHGRQSLRKCIYIWRKK